MFPADAIRGFIERRRRRGTILIVTMVLVFAIAAMALVLCRSMAVEAIAAANQAASIQALAVERGAEQYVLALLADQGAAVLDLDEQEFAAVPIGPGYFWVLRPAYDDDNLPLFGLVDEASKLDLNAPWVTPDVLENLPGMTAEIAAAIVDWRDPRSAEPGGAKDEYYLSLPEPYVCKNRPFETVEELLLVRDVTRQLVWGDGTAGPLGTRSTLGGNSTSVISDEQLARGWRDLLTVSSVSSNTDPTGAQRASARSDNARLPVLQRLGNTRANDINRAAGRVGNLSELCSRGGIRADELAQIIDYLSDQSGRQLRGRINVNSAPREVLACLVGSADADKLISARPSRSGESTSIAWAVTALGNNAIPVADRMIGHSYRYSADILAVSGNGRAFKRCRIVIDTQQSPARVIYRRDLTDRGWPMDPQVLASLRSGQWAQGGSSSPGGMLR